MRDDLDAMGAAADLLCTIVLVVALIAGAAALLLLS